MNQMLSGSYCSVLITANSATFLSLLFASYETDEHEIRLKLSAYCFLNCPRTNLWFREELYDFITAFGNINE